MTRRFPFKAPQKLSLDLRLIGVCSGIFFLSLTPQERWDALRRFDTNIMTERWFIITGVIAIIVLTAMLFAVSLHRRMRELRVTSRLFGEYAEKRGLSERERQILLDIVSRAKLKRSEAIFTMAGAFDRGASKLVEEGFAGQRTAEENRRLKMELSFLREKLGFHKQRLSSAGSLRRPRKLSSRQIPVGKKLHITRRRIGDSSDIEPTVIKNDDVELTVKLPGPVESSRGELWRARYYFGASVWEFDTSVVSCNGDILVLNHSDSVRFVNRRRFLRVPVNRPAFIARFPFARTAAEDSEGRQTALGGGWGPPGFVSAVVTELAGPGLRVEAPLEVKVGERVLVVFRLDEEKGPDLISGHGPGEGAAAKIVEDIGEVRHTEVIQNGLSIAVELTGLSDTDVNELIRATNAASVRAGVEGRDIPAGADTKQVTEGRVRESSATRRG